MIEGSFVLDEVVPEPGFKFRVALADDCQPQVTTANHANVTDQAHEALGIFVLLQHDAGFFDVNLL